MLVSHNLKRIELEKRGGDLDRAVNRPDSIRQDFIEAYPDWTDAQVEDEVFDQQAFYISKDVQLIDIVEILGIEINARASGQVNRNPIGTTYYVDGDAGNNGSAGTSIGAAWLDIDQFTENARVAGDICIVRRATTIDDGTDLVFTSDGTKVDPIKIKADNANEFSDDVDLSATATATLTFGSKTITFSADISSVLAAGDVIYASGDDADDFAYEVDSISGASSEIATLFLPYKGAQAGSSKTMTNMKANPIWNTAAGNFQWNFDTDRQWQIQGIHIRGTDANGNVEIDTADGKVFKDCVFEGNGAGDLGLNQSDDCAWVHVVKCRFFNHVVNLGNQFTGGGAYHAILRDCLLDGNSVASSRGISKSRWNWIQCIDCEFKGHTDHDIAPDAADEVSQIFLRNCILGATTEIGLNANTGSGASSVFSEDHDGVIGDTAQYHYFGGGANVQVIESDVGTVRSGGGSVSIKVTPSTKMGIKWDLSILKLFEHAFYANTDSKTYTVYFRPNATADWTADPLATELWIELEYWGHASNNFRRIIKSTEVIDMNGSTDWQTLTVTVAPSQSGLAYLRCYYGKTKESGVTNNFFCDPRPEIT